MTAPSFVHLLSYLEPVSCAFVLLALVSSGSVRKFPSLAALLGVRLVSGTTCLTIIGLSGHGIERHLGYKIYFYTYWVSYAIEALLSLLVIYSIFKLAMAPLKGLATLGILVFRWAGAISVAISIGMAIGPHFSGAVFLVAIVTQLQQTSSILTLCLLLRDDRNQKYNAGEVRPDRHADGDGNRDRPGPPEYQDAQRRKTLQRRHRQLEDAVDDEQ